MKLWEYHRDLATAIGDKHAFPVVQGQRVIPNGSRFPRELRASYLYRAAMSIYTKIYRQLAAQPKDVYVSVLERYFPNSIKTYTHTLDPGDFTVQDEPAAKNSFVQVSIALPSLELFSSQAITYGRIFALLRARGQDGLGTVQNVPIREGAEVNNNAFKMNAYTVNELGARKSPYIINDLSEISDNGFLRLLMYNPLQYHETSNNDGVEEQARFQVGDTITITYIETPFHPERYIDIGGVAETFINSETDWNVEEQFIPEILQLATWYALGDSQESEYLERFAPLTAGLGNATQ